ncbi:MAG TPA: YajG family lipoprotein [Thermoanaerobaculia bacterium]|nr:YajG family lipoprotein [Thermoanaerobaculia bacterium]
MNPNQWKLVLLGALVLGTAQVGAADKGPFTVSLRYSPQESVATSSAVLGPGMNERPVQVTMEDGRAGSDPAVIGDCSDDDDKMWPVKASNSVVTWADEVLRKNLGDWGIKVSPDAPQTLAGKLTRVRVVESNKAVGSTYQAEVQVAFALKNAQGGVLWEGTALGDATRFGRARSQENVNEVLSDAIKETYANALNDAGLQNAWVGKAAPRSESSSAAKVPSGPSISPADLLAELVKLKKQSFTTELLVDYVNQKNLGSPLTADDMVSWKQAGMPQEVIKAALARSGN